MAAGGPRGGMAARDCGAAGASGATSAGSRARAARACPTNATALPSAGPMHSGQSRAWTRKDALLLSPAGERGEAPAPEQMADQPAGTPSAMRCTRGDRVAARSNVQKHASTHRAWRIVGRDMRRARCMVPRLWRDRPMRRFARARKRPAPGQRSHARCRGLPGRKVSCRNLDCVVSRCLRRPALSGHRWSCCGCPSGASRRRKPCRPLLRLRP